MFIYNIIQLEKRRKRALTNVIEVDYYYVIGKKKKQ